MNGLSKKTALPKENNGKIGRLLSLRIVSMVIIELSEDGGSVSKIAFTDTGQSEVLLTSTDVSTDVYQIRLPQLEEFICRSSAELRALISEQRGAALISKPDSIDIYRANLGPAPYNSSEFKIILPNGKLLVAQCAATTESMQWEFAWNSHFGQKNLIFVPSLSTDSLIGENVDLGGREFTGRPVDSRHSIQHCDGAMWVVSPLPGDISLYPPLQLQIPRIKEACIVSADSTNQDSITFDPERPYAVFGVVASFEDQNDHAVTHERMVIAYRDFLLVAERETTQGVPADCAAWHWQDSLRICKTVPDASFMEAGPRDLDLKYLSYYTFPRELGELAPRNPVAEPGSMARLKSHEDFYRLMQDVIVSNSFLGNHDISVDRAKKEEERGEMPFVFVR